MSVSERLSSLRWLLRTRSTIIATMTAAARAANAQRCQPPASARNEKAAPVLCARTRLNPVHTGRTSLSEKFCSNQIFVA